MHFFTQNTSSNSLNSAAMQNFYLTDKKVKTERLCNLPIGTLLMKKELEFKSFYIRGAGGRKWYLSQISLSSSKRCQMFLGFEGQISLK